MQSAKFPHESVAVQVTVVFPTGNCAGALLVTTTPPQPGALTVGEPRVTLVAKQEPGSALTVTSGGQVIRGGGVVTTMTRCWQEALLPLASLTVHVTKFVPSGKRAGASLVTEATQFSLTVGAPSDTFEAVSKPGSVATVTST